MKVDRHVAQYGSVRLERAYCDDCKRIAIVLDNRFQCCDRTCSEAPTKEHRQMSEVPFGRKGPGAATRKRILNFQDHRCAYCLKRFGATVWRRNREIKLRVEWDHAVPYSYSCSNLDSNFVASCQVCNGIKASRLFSSVEDVAIYVNEQREAKGYSDVRPLLKTISPETPTSKIL